MQLNFIQSNWLRQYPFRYNHGILDLNNNEVPIDILVGLRITCRAADLEVFINKLYVNYGNVSVSFAGSNGDIGYASGTITDDNQGLVIYNYTGGAIGTVMFGNNVTTQNNYSFVFNNTNGLVEPSTVLVLPTPGVQGIFVKGVKYTGDVNFTSSTVNITTDNSIALSVIHPSTIESKGDKCSSYLTCDNNVIGGINTVKPSQAGNIDIYTIEPLTISPSSSEYNNQLQLSVGDGVALSNKPISGLNLCKASNIPPTNTTQTYPNISTVTNPEWESWTYYI